MSGALVWVRFTWSLAIWTLLAAMARDEDEMLRRWVVFLLLRRRQRDSNPLRPRPTAASWRRVVMAPMLLKRYNQLYDTIVYDGNAINLKKTRRRKKSENLRWLKLCAIGVARSTHYLCCHKCPTGTVIPRGSSLVWRETETRCCFGFAFGCWLLGSYRQAMALALASISSSVIYPLFSSCAYSSSWCIKIWNPPTLL